MLKRMLVVMLVAGTLVPALGARPQAAGVAYALPLAAAPDTITLTLQAPAYELTSLDGGLTALDAEGCALTGRPGAPLLPHQILDVALPPDADWNSLVLEVRDVRTEAVPGTYQLRTAQPYCPCNEPPVEVAPDPAAGAPLVARIAATGQMRRWRLARLDFSPFLYDPATGQLQVVQQATAELHFSRGGGVESAELLADTALDEAAAEQVVNYADARSWYPQTPQPENVLWDYAIVTTKAIAANSTRLGAFIDHKQAQGHHLLLVTEDDYGTGADRADKVRQWLHDNYASLGIKYVLLIGDPIPGGSGGTDLPMKQCWPRQGMGIDEDAPTDYYYADLTGNWNIDGDQYWGEYHGDYMDAGGNVIPGGVDLFPEVYVGRIPFYDNYTDLDHILQKTIDYETSTDTAWRQSILLPMSFVGAGYDTAPLAEQMWNDFLSPAGYSRWRMYQQGSAPCAPDSAYASDQELRGGTMVRDRWAANDYGIVTWWGHGNSALAAVGWGDSPPVGCADGVLFSNTQTSALDDNHPSFTYQCSCSTAYPEDTNNLAYAILKQGGIATVGATRVSYNGPSTYGDFDHSDGNGGIGYVYVQRLVQGYTASEALYQAKYLSAVHLYPFPDGEGGLANMFDFNLYGDPDVRITDSALGDRSYLSIPAAAFSPAADGYDYENHGRFLLNYTSGAGINVYLAPVHLPQGSMVTSVTFQWHDVSTAFDGVAVLRKTFRAGDITNMALAYTFAEGGYGSTRDPTVYSPIIDNQNASYWLEWDIRNGPPDVSGCNVLIEYVPPPSSGKGYLSLPAAAFRPFEDGYDYNDAGVWLAHYHGPGGSNSRGWYLAPVQLPDGARVTKMTFYYYDDYVADNILARLQRTDLVGNYYEMAYADSSGANTGYGSKSDTTIDNPIVDNQHNSYWVIWDGPVYTGSGHDASGVAVLIEYGQPAMLSGHLSLPAPAFTPFADEWEYQNHGRYLIHQGPASASRAHYEAPVYLPQGARVTRVSFWFNDDSTSANGYAHLCRTDRAGNYSYMASIDSYYAWGYAMRSVNAIDDKIIDNARYGYWAYWDLPISTGSGNDVWGTGMTIDYTLPMLYLPLVLRAH